MRSCGKSARGFWLRTYEGLLQKYLEVWHILPFAMSGSLQCRYIRSFCDALLVYEDSTMAYYRIVGGVENE